MYRDSTAAALNGDSTSSLACYHFGHGTSGVGNYSSAMVYTKSPFGLSRVSPFAEVCFVERFCLETEREIWMLRRALSPDDAGHLNWSLGHLVIRANNSKAFHSQ